MPNPQIVQSEDGSHTLFSHELNEHYHSIHGAIQESQHVFIEMGLNALPGSHEEIIILEVGFGTGLNAYLSLLAVRERSVRVSYTGIELYPLLVETAQLLNYPALLADENPNTFIGLHTSEWNLEVKISESFSLHKISGSILEIKLEDDFNLIYFDAFSPDTQPELWTLEVFEKMYNSLIPGGILVTYCAKGQVRRNMQEAGFKVERIPGPPFKRQMMRATKQV